MPAVSLANYGLETDYITCLPDNPIAERCIMDLRGHKVGVDHIQRTGKRIGVNANTTIALLTAIAILGLLMCVVQFAVGRFIGHYFNHTQEAGQALGQKNIAFAIWLSTTYLNPLSSVGPGCYILWQNIINSIEIWQHRKTNKE